MGTLFPTVPSLSFRKMYFPQPLADYCLLRFIPATPKTIYCPTPNQLLAPVV